LKKAIFVGWMLALAALLALGQGWMAALALLGLFVWLAVETKRRQAFSFLLLHRDIQRVLILSPDLHVVWSGRHEAHALVLEHGPRFSLVDFNSGKKMWSRELPAPQAVLPAPGGGLYVAEATQLKLLRADGSETALGFEAPLLRQNYSLHLSGNGRTLALQTPWFIQFFAPDLSRLGARIRYEEAGHFLKHAALSFDGNGLLLAGALLLEEDEEDGAGGLEARWDYWTQAQDGAWKQAWAQAHSSASNSHLRGVSISEDGSILAAEIYQDGYEFKLFKPDGTLLWQRLGGERPALSPQGKYLLWENSFTGVELSTVLDQKQLWAQALQAKLRLKAVDSQGRCLLLEGTRLRVLDAKGAVLWEDYFKEDPAQLSLGPGGRLAVIKDDKLGLLKVPFGD
jgi:hypothetical protein